jgi:DNA-binding FadR family transcriptional regulator
MIARQSLPDQVFRHLVGGILSGRYAAGGKLPPQRALAAELGVNMASVREGVKRLEQAKLVETRHGDGMRVTDWRAAGGLDVLGHVALDAGVIAEVFEARRVLLAESAALAARRRSPAQAQLLRDLAEQLRTTDDDPTAQGLDLAFMATVIEAAGNLAFSLIANSIRTSTSSGSTSSARSSPGARSSTTAGSHRAIAAGEAERARKTMRALAAAQEARLQ